MAHTPTPQQRKAIETIDRNLAVTAGAGSGKTRVLVDRYLHLLKTEVNVNEILAITFTRKAALEMKERIRAGIAADPQLSSRLLHEFNQAQISTIHAFCQRLVADHPCQAQIDPRFRMAEEWESRGLLLQIVEEQVALARANQDPELTALGESYRQTSSFVADLVEIYERIISKGDPSFKVPDQSAELRPQIAALRQELLVRLPAWLDSLVAAELSDSKQQVTTDIRRVFNEYLANLKEPLRSEREIVSELAGLFGGNWAKDLKAEVQELKELCSSLSQLLFDLEANEILLKLGDLLAAIEEEYQRRKKALGLLDYNDLERFAEQLLSHGEIDQAYRYRHVMVDEAQDINLVQKRIIASLADHPEAKLFVVGDPKQSIYRFRGAQVEVFLELQNEIKASGGLELTLGDNFRSRPELIEFSNKFFSQVFADGLMQFTPANPKRERKGQPLVAVLQTAKGENSADERAAEAEQIAKYIRHLTAEQGYRYKDITLLFSSMTYAGIYERELHKHRIPFVNLSGRGFYQRPEIQDILHFVKWLQDSSDQISQICVLRSPFFAVSDHGLYWYQAGKFDQIVPEDQEKIAAAHKLYPFLQQQLVTLPAPQFIDTLLEATDFCGRTLSLPMGEQRLANIKKLQETSWQLWAKGYVSFTEQLHYIDQLIEQQGREGEARLDSESADVVTIMTIHGSKGLEFPVVILPDLCRPAVTPERGRLHYHPEWGLTLRDTTVHQQIKAVLKQEAVAEAKRLLYVAATRAEEQLVLCGVGTASDYKLGQPLENLRSWWEWILSGLEQIEPELFATISEIETGENYREETAAAVEAISTSIPKITVPDHYTLASFSATSLMIYALCPRRYYYRYLLRVPELVSAGQGNTVSGTLDPLQRGNIVHRVCEHLHTGADAQELLDWAIAMEGIKVSSREREELDQIIQRYLTGDFFQGIQGLKVEHEVEFAVPLDQFLITGTIDQVIHTEQGLKIMDLKTNQITPEQVAETAASYEMQLRIYAWALHIMTRKPILEAGLYFLFPDVIYRAESGCLDTEATEKWLLEACRQIQRGEKEQADAFPVADDCRYCPYDCRHLDQTRINFGEITAGMGKLEIK